MKVEFCTVGGFSGEVTVQHTEHYLDIRAIDFLMAANVITLPGQERFSVDAREVIFNGEGSAVGAVALKLYGNYIGS